MAFQAENTAWAQAWRRDNTAGMVGEEGGGVQVEMAALRVLILPSAEGSSSPGSSAGSLRRTCQPPPALPALRFLPREGGTGDDLGAAALRCILIQHRAPAGCPYIRGCVILLLSEKGSGGDNCVSLGKNTGAGSVIFLSALGEEMSTHHPSPELGGAGRSV